jgi:hypothetical protein
MNWRITERIRDRSAGINTVTGTTAGFVIRSNKGPAKPVFISRRDPETLIDLFGFPGPNNPEVMEAIAYNRKHPLWICTTQNVADKHGGVIVNTTSYESFDPQVGGNGLSGLTSAEIATGPSFVDTTELFYVLTAFPHSQEDLQFRLTYNDSADTWNLELQKLEFNKWVAADTYTFSLLKDTKDGFGKSIYYKDVFEDSIYIQIITNGDEDATTGIFADYQTVIGGIALGNSDFQRMTDGTKATAAPSEILAAWDEFENREYSSLKLFVDTTGDSSIPGKFSTMRTTYHKYSTFLSPLPMGTSYTDLLAIREVGNHLAAFNNPGVAFSWIHHRERNPFGGQSFWTSMVGSWASKIGDMDTIFYGKAPAGVDEDGIGGQITDRTVLESEFSNISDTQLQAADQQAGVNPILVDPGFGLMIHSHRTGQIPSTVTDTSFIGHSMLYDTIRNYIRNEVLLFQAVKLNDEVHQRQVRNKINSYLAPIFGLGLLNQEGTLVICDNTNNTDEVRAARNFAVTVVLQVNPFSEGIVVDYIYLGQTNSIEEVIN